MTFKPDLTKVEKMKTQLMNAVIECIDVASAEVGDPPAFHLITTEKGWEPQRGPDGRGVWEFMGESEGHLRWPWRFTLVVIAYVSGVVVGVFIANYPHKAYLYFQVDGEPFQTGVEEFDDPAKLAARMAPAPALLGWSASFK